MSKGELLMIVHRIPYPPDKGDKIRSFNQLKYLSENGWVVHLCCLADDAADLKYREVLEKYCASVSIEPLNPMIQKLLSLSAPFRGLPMSARYFYKSRLQRRIDELLRSRSLKAILCYCSPMAEYLHRSTQPVMTIEGSGSTRCSTRCVMDLVDVDSDKWDQYARRSRAPMSWIYSMEGRLLHRYERQIAESFDATVLVSEAESEVLRKRLARRFAIESVGNGVDLDYFHLAPAGPQQRNIARITFCGAMAYLPNVDAVTWFAKDVLPHIRQQMGEVEFWIVGAGAGEEVLALQRLPGVRVTGRVEDVRPFVWDSDLSVAPIRIARGIQNKVLESMALGVVPLVTPHAFEGLEAEAGRDLVVAPAEPRAFAAAAVEILRDPTRRRLIARSGRKLVEDNYSWRVRLQVLEDLLLRPRERSLLPVVA